MSKAFTKEDDGGEVVLGRPVRRASEPRPITRRGWDALVARAAALESEQAALDPTAPDAATRRQALTHQRELVAATLASVQVLDPPASPTHVAFGCRVRLRGERGEREVVLVGPDESDPKTGRISVHSPVGRALIAAEVGAEVELHRPGGVEPRVEIVAVVEIRAAE
jgi:transcription elongation GreA/GreB family factor